jgi:predicted MFS family arabinose efflux permease
MTSHGLCVALAALTGAQLISRFTARTLIGVGLVGVALGHGRVLLATSIPMMAGRRRLGAWNGACDLRNDGDSCADKKPLCCPRF